MRNEQSEKIQETTFLARAKRAFLNSPSSQSRMGEKDERRERERKKRKRRIAVKNNESRESVNTEGFER